MHQWISVHFHMAKVILFLTLIIVSFFSCLYSPSQQPLPFSPEQKNNQQGGKTGTGTIYAVNIGQQTCNPSICPGQNFPASLLWLGFDNLSVRVPREVALSYSLTNIQTHDRLTITDTANTVRWFIFRKDFSPRGEIQCPEWSTNPDYIACLTGTKTRPYNGYAIRLSDKKSLKLLDSCLEEFSTPHLWISSDAQNQSTTPDTAIYNQSGIVDNNSLLNFFGTNKVRFTYTLPSKSGSIYYIDFAKSPVPIALPKPSDKETWTCHSPMISPDGNWVAYHCYLIAAQGMLYASYIQRLSPDSKPVLISEEASDPHWWVDKYNDNDYYIIYTFTPGPYFIESEARSLDNSLTAGATLKKKLIGTWQSDVPLHVKSLSPDNSVAPDTLVKFPFKGGLSPDGRFLGTGYKYAYIMKLE
jgi:hypothetical protein